MREEVALVVLVREVLRAEHVQVVCTETRVEREKDFLCYDDRVVSSDLTSQLHVVAMFSSDVSRLNLLLCDGVKAIEELHGSVTVGVSLRFPYRLV